MMAITGKIRSVMHFGSDSDSESELGKLRGHRNWALNPDRDNTEYEVSLLSDLNEQAHIYLRGQDSNVPGKLFRVHVGQPTEVFCVPEEIICAKSKYFTKLRDKKDEARANARNVETMGDCAVNLIQFRTDIFHGNFDYETESSNGTRGLIGFIPLDRAYVLGVMLEDFGFKNTVVNAMITVSQYTFSNGTQYVPGAKVLRVIYGGTTQRHFPARRLLVDLYLLKPKLMFIESMEMQDLPLQFMRELAVAMIEQMSEERFDAPWPVGEIYKEQDDTMDEHLACASPTYYASEG